MALDPKTSEELYTILLDAFSSDELTRLVRFYLGENIDAIVQGKNQSEVVFEVMAWADRRGRIDELIAAAYGQRQNSPEFARFMQQHGYAITQGESAPLVDDARPLSSSPKDSAPRPANRKLNVFLCHASEDKQAIRELYQRLKADGVDPWLDEEDLLPGQQWEIEIPKAVRNADVVLVCLSNHTLDKDGYVQKETQFALDAVNKLSPDNIYLIPARLEECFVPDSLKRWHWVDLFDERGYPRLLKALQARANNLGCIQPEVATSETTAPPKSGALEPAVPKIATPKTAAEPKNHVPKPAAPKIATPKTAIDFEWVHVPAGEFQMGSDEDEDEQPIHAVYVDDFYIAKTPVTNRQYKRFVDAAGHRSPRRWDNGQIPNGKDDHPVVYVSWHDAQAFCKWAGVHLPTEAQWEKAASWDANRKIKRTYPWGDQRPDETLCNFKGNVGGTTSVDAYPRGASFYGCLDMAGNVWEWTSTLYKSYSYNTDDGREDLDRGGWRTLRGGSFVYYGDFVRCANRDFGYQPGDGNDDYSFRVVVVV